MHWKFKFLPVESHSDVVNIIRACVSLYLAKGDFVDLSKLKQMNTGNLRSQFCIGISSEVWKMYVPGFEQPVDLFKINLVLCYTPYTFDTLKHMLMCYYFYKLLNAWFSISIL